jgi:hypothetical protein
MHSTQDDHSGSSNSGGTMRRTLAVLVTAGVFLVPAGAASAEEVVAPTPDPVHLNASCNNMKSGNYLWTDHEYNGRGRVLTAECIAGKRPVKVIVVKDSQERPVEVDPDVNVY